MADRDGEDFIFPDFWDCRESEKKCSYRKRVWESVKKILTNEDGYVILLVAYRVCEELNAGKDVQRWRMENM